MKPTGERDEGFDRLVEAGLARDGRVPGACPQVETLAAWFDGSLPSAAQSSPAGGQGRAEEAVGIEAHLAGCSRCRQVVAGLARSEPEVLYVHPKPERAPFTWHLRWLAPVAAAALIVLAVGSQVLRAPGAGAPSPSPAAREATATAQAPAAPPAEPAAAASSAAPPAREQVLARAKPSVPAPSDAAKDTAKGKAGEEHAEAKGGIELQADARETRDTLDKTITRSANQPEGAAKTEAVAAPAQGRPQPTALTETLAAAPPAAASRPASAPAAPAPPPPPAARDVSESRLRLATVAGAMRPASAFAPGGLVGWRYVRPGVVSRTDDGGSTWIEQVVPGTLRLSLFSVISASECWAAGPAGALARTTDGTTWQVVTPPVSEDLVSLAAQGSKRAIVRTAAGVTYETADAGATWHRR